MLPSIKPNEMSVRILTIMRIDAGRVFERIKYRQAEYLHHFSSKRTRDHFSEIFKNRYDQLTAHDLKFCGEEVIIGLDQFYSKVEELKWYMMITNEMPGSIEEHVTHVIRELEEAFEILQLYINAELESYRSKSDRDEESVG